MFDSYTLRAGDQHHSHHHEVHEHRAPTDKSVALLREMEKAAEQKWLDSFRLGGCEVDCVVHHQRVPQTGDHRFVVVYRLGGKRIDVRHDFQPKLNRSEHDERQRLVDELLQAVGDSIARQILAPAMDRALTTRQFP